MKKNMEALCNEVHGYEDSVSRESDWVEVTERSRRIWNACGWRLMVR